MEPNAQPATPDDDEAPTPILVGYDGSPGAEQALTWAVDEAARLEEASAQPDEVEEPSTDERDRLELEASKARTHETELRLTLRTKEERARAVKGRAESLEGAARNELAARERLRQRQERRQLRGVAPAVARHVLEGP